MTMMTTRDFNDCHFDREQTKSTTLATNGRLIEGNAASDSTIDLQSHTNQKTYTDIPTSTPSISISGNGGNQTSVGQYTILAFYQFITVQKDVDETADSANDSYRNLSQIRSDIEMKLRTYTVRGSIILATEGINGNISYPTQISESANKPISNVDPVEQFLSSIYKNLKIRKSLYTQHVFYRLKVRIKSEIVTLGEIPSDLHLPMNESITISTAKSSASTGLSVNCETIDIANVKETYDADNKRTIHPSHTSIGQYVPPGMEWDSLIEDPNCAIIDVRNSYEVAIGTFENAINPNTKSFIEFTEWLKNYLQHNRPQKIAMFCTGGIRCEKSTSLCNHLLLAQYQEQQQLQSLGSASTTENTKYELPPVYHLDGGILAYLDKYGASTTTSSSTTSHDTCHPVQEINDIGYQTNSNTEKSAQLSQINKQDTTVLDSTTDTALLKEYSKKAIECEKDLNKNTSRIQSTNSNAESKSKLNGKFHGECYVFDQRVAVTYGLQPSTTYTTCYVCRHPLTEQDRSNIHYTLGVECPYCYASVQTTTTGSTSPTATTAINRQRHKSRQEQFERINQKQQQQTSTIIKSKTEKKRQQQEVGQNIDNSLVEKSKQKVCDNNQTSLLCARVTCDDQTYTGTSTLVDKSCLHLYDAKELKLARQRKLQEQQSIHEVSE